MNALSTRQLSALYRHEVFRSCQADETQALVSSQLKEHRSRWGHGTVDAAFHRAELGSLSLCILRYGREVEIEPDALGSFVLVQMPLRGCADVHLAGETVRIQPGQGAVISAHKPVRVHWHAGCEQLMLKIERDHLLDVARQAMPPRLADRLDRIDFTARFRLDDDFGTQWRLLVAGLVALLPRGQGAAGASSAPSLSDAASPATVQERRSAFDAEWMRRYQDNLVHYLLCHQPNSAWDGAAAARTDDAAHGSGPLRRAEDYMRSRLAEAQSLDDIARAAGVSRRSLSLLFRRHREISPMEALRNMRLDAAHAQLLRQSAPSITDIALDCGFVHLSRFAASYRERFGELPNTTWRGGITKH